MTVSVAAMSLSVGLWGVSAPQLSRGFLPLQFIISCQTYQTQNLQDQTLCVCVTVTSPLTCFLPRPLWGGMVAPHVDKHWCQGTAQI